MYIDIILYNWVVTDIYISREAIFLTDWHLWEQDMIKISVLGLCFLFAAVPKKKIFKGRDGCYTKASC